MLSLLPALAFTFLRLSTPTPAAAPPPAPNAAEPTARLETTALGADARRLAASVLVDADAIADVVLVDRAAVFEVELGGERHELRVELDARGGVVGASVWWVGDAEGVHRYDLAAAMPALMEAESLDAIRVDGERASIVVAGEEILLDGEADAALDEESWGC